jgi:hypothetical protein
MRTAFVVLLAFAVMMIGASAKAGCTCECANGQMQPLCENAMDMPPICPPTICPIASPSIAPIPTPMVPPIGTSECQPERVCDTFGNCRWETVCQ